MKLTKLISHVTSRNGIMGTSLFYSTTAKAQFATQRGEKSQIDELFRRISPIGDPKQSIVPILDQWIDEGNTINQVQLYSFIKQLRSYRRYSHALQISMWMTDKRYYQLTPGHVAVRLNLMSRVLGIEQVEKFFDLIPQQFKGCEVYGALLNCYVYAKSVNKAEALMLKMRDLGFLSNRLAYNDMLNLYYKTGNIEKFDAWMHEMEQKGIVLDNYAIGIQLGLYASVSDINGIEKTIRKMESDRNLGMDWSNYFIAAKGYMKAGLMDKALAMLKKAERLVTTKNRRKAYNFLLTQYAAIGKKDEVWRLWECYVKLKVYNIGYLSFISALLKLDDLESAENIFEEWESQNLYYDIRIPNFLIATYSKKGHVDKAEALVDRVISKGGVPNSCMWYCMLTAYLQNNQNSKALKMMKKAITVRGSKFKPSIKILVSCLEYLKGQQDLEEAEGFLKLAVDNGIISLDVQEKLLNNIRTPKSETVRLGDNRVVEDENVLDFPKSEFGNGDNLPLENSEFKYDKHQ